MQNKKGGKQYFVRDESTPWYRGQLFTVGVMLLSTALWFVSSLTSLHTVDFKPRLLILRSEGCAYLQLHKVQTKPYPIANTCAAEVPFKYRPFSENGDILGSEEHDEVFVNGSQIVATEALPDRPWTPAQRREAIRFALGTLLYISIFTLMFKLF